MRVDEVLAELGSPASGAVLTWTDTTLFARIELTDAQRAVVGTGTAVIVALINGEVVGGVVGQVTETQFSEPEGWLPAAARIDIADQDALADIGLGSVAVELVQNKIDEALVVPVTALFALAEGGFVVELVNGTMVGVEVGLVADTLAEVTPLVPGALKEGDEVLVK